MLERIGANTVSPMATHLVTLRYLPGVTTKTSVVFHDVTDRTLAVTGVFDHEARHRVLVLGCVERVT
jgi:head-tail adaptor